MQTRDTGERLHYLLLIEPGPTLAQTLLSQNLPDRLWVFHSLTGISSTDAPSAPPIHPDYITTATLPLAPDTLTEYLNPQSPVFLYPTPSADIRSPQ